MFAIRKKRTNKWLYKTDYAHKYIRKNDIFTFAQFTSTTNAKIFASREDAEMYIEAFGVSERYYEIVAVKLVVRSVEDDQTEA